MLYSFWFSLVLFVIGLIGILVVRKNLIIIIMCIELLLLSININFIIFSANIDDIYGQICALLVLTIAASESSVGLAILVVYYRLKGIISTQLISNIKG